MSADEDIIILFDKNTECPNESQSGESLVDQAKETVGDEVLETAPKKPSRKVSFPVDDQLVTQYFEPANPWHEVVTTSRAQLAAEYLESCRRHNTPPIESVLQQIRELPENCIGGSARAGRLTLSECLLVGTAPADALEAVLKKVQFRRLEIDAAAIDDEGAEAIFDMVEYYESATAVCISGPRQYGIRGWQAASRMIKKSCQLSELEITNHPLSSGHAPVLARALNTHTCRVRVLCLQRTMLSGEPLLCLVIALKSNSSVRELRLGDNRLTASDAAQLSSLLRLNTRLQLLDLSNNQIQDAGVGHIADALVDQAAQTPPSAATSPLSPHHCPVTNYESRGLAFLVLWNNQLTRNCAVHLMRALRVSQSLCVLNIGRNSVGSETVRALVCGGSLVSLGLQCARLGAGGDAPRALHELILNTKLQRLDLRDNKLGVQGLQAILSAMKENTTLTQIDLDDPVESSTLTAEDNESATVSRLTREIRARCRSNEPSATSPERRVHRKISLTCHTACLTTRMGVVAEEDIKRSASGRLRSPAPSPAPSPAGSPVPSGHSRFSVTRVTPERECSSDSPSPTTSSRGYCSPTSRFRVVQVAEPPQIQVNAEPRRSSSRFSVTRNYDTIYNPVPAAPPPSPAPIPRPSDNITIGSIHQDPIPSSVFTHYDRQVDASDHNESACGYSEKTKSEAELDNNVNNDRNNVSLEKSTDMGTSIHLKGDSAEFKDISASCKDASAALNDTSTDCKVNSVDYKDKSEQLCHNEEVNVVGDDEILKTETKLVKNSTEVSDSEKVDVQVEVRVNTESSKPAKVHNDQVACKNDVNIDESVKGNDTIDKEHENVCENKNKVELSEKQAGRGEKREDVAMKQIEAITEDLGNLIQEMKHMSTKTAGLTKKDVKVRSDATQTDVHVNINVDKSDNVPVNLIRDSVVLKKNKSESSLDSPDLEVSRLMTKKINVSAFCDSSSSLEISGSSMESLNALDNPNTEIMKPIIIQETVESDNELDRRKPEQSVLSTESSIESTSDVTPVNSGNFLNTSVSSNDSVSPIFGKNKKIHGSLSSLEASVSSLDSTKHEKIMVTSADSGIEYSLQNPSESKDDNSSNEGTLTNNSSLKEPTKKPESVQETLTSSPKRVSSLLDVPASVLKTKSLDRMRKISWVAPSSSFHIPKPEPEKPEIKLPSHLEKLLSLFQHPSSLFSRNTNEDEKKSASNTPPRKDSSLTSSFWSWGSATEKEKEDNSEATDSTLSERIQVSFVDESFSRKLDSKTPSTDTETTLSEFQSFPIQGNSESDASQEVDKNICVDKNISQDIGKVSQDTCKVTDVTTDLLVQNLVLSDNGSVRASDNQDLMKPNDCNRNYDMAGDANKNTRHESEVISKLGPQDNTRQEIQDFNARQEIPDNNTVNDLQNINIGEEAQAKITRQEVSENIFKKETHVQNARQEKSEKNIRQESVEKDDNIKFDEVPAPSRPRSFASVLKSSGSENSLGRPSPDNGQSVDKLPTKVIRGIKENISPENTLTSSMTNTKALAFELTERQIKNQPIVNAMWEITVPLLEKPEPKAPIATIEETCDESVESNMNYDDFKYIDEKNVSTDSGVTSLEGAVEEIRKGNEALDSDTGCIDLGKDALSYLIDDNQDFEPGAEHTVANMVQAGSLAQELKDAELKEKLLDLSPELVMDEVVETDVFLPQDLKKRMSPVIPERAKIKKANSLENLGHNVKNNPKIKTIAFKIPETSTPCDIPERRNKLRSRSGSSPKSLPESLYKPSPLSKMESISKKKKKISSLGKLARDSLLALNMSEEEIAEFRRSYKLTSVESLKSLESVSEDANSQSGTSVDSRCKACMRMSQESLMSLDSISEDCRCTDECGKDKPGRSVR